MIRLIKKHRFLTGTIALLLGTAMHAQSSNFYINSKTGNDGMDGKSPGKAWRTIKAVNNHTFAPGDSVLFCRGSVWEEQLAPVSSGSAAAPLVFSAYGKGDLPKIKANGKFSDAVLLKNIQNIVVEQLDISNWDDAVPFQQQGPTGVRILAENIGTLHNIRLTHLYVHDINGDNRKGTNEGCGIFWDCQGPLKSNIEHLVIEDCTVKHVDRNGIRGNGTFAIRTNWFPNKHLLISRCLLEDIGGDGIVVKAFDTALVEHNRLFNIRTRAKDNAVGIWPHSSDHTTIQYNEVAYTRNANWANDGQSFDIDGNCRYTTIQYNYSHDNEGGFMLVISDAINKDNVMTRHNIIRYNLSVNDALNRKRLFNFAGITDSTLLQGNVFYNDAPQAYAIEMTEIEGGLPTNVLFADNYFEFRGKNGLVFTKSPKQYSGVNFSNNIFEGLVTGTDNLANKNTIDKHPPQAVKHGAVITAFPWKYLPANLKNNPSKLPPALYRAIYGK